MIPVAEPLLGEEEIKNLTEAVNSGWISSKGKFIGEFEEGFARYCGVKYGVATCNGTVALHLALAALDIKEGDEVISPTLTFVATANAARYTGARPVFVDSTKEYWGIDPAKIEKAVTAKTRAIMPVHLYGHPCDMEAINAIAKKHHLYVIEDAAESHGAEQNGRKVGSFSDIACFSFYGNKIITTGEGGMCLTNDKNLYDAMRILRDHGMNPEKKYWHDKIGFNYRMTNMQAAVGVAQLKKLEQFIGQKRQIAKLYAEYLGDLANNGLVQLHPEMPWARCVYWMCSILVNDKAKVNRDELMHKLLAKGIESRPFFYPIHVMPPYRDYPGQFPVAEKLSKNGINLPSSVTLNADQIKEIANCIKNSLVR